MQSFSLFALHTMCCFFLNSTANTTCTFVYIFWSRFVCHFTNYVLHTFKLLQSADISTLSHLHCEQHNSGELGPEPTAHELLDWEFGCSWPFHSHQPWKGNQSFAPPCISTSAMLCLRLTSAAKQMRVWLQPLKASRFSTSFVWRTKEISAMPEEQHAK